MIITTPFELKSGQIYTEKDLSGSKFEYLGNDYWAYRFYVIRQATLEEYREYVKTIYEFPDDIMNKGFYYEISMD